LNTKTFDQAVNVQGATVTSGADGGLGPTAWPENHFLPTGCTSVVKIDGGKYTVAKPFSCYPSLRLR
jgi:hypothetical protein